MIWEATENDLFGIGEMGRRFHKAADLDGVFAPSAFWDFCKFLINSDNGCLFRSEQGMIGALISSPPWDNTFKIATESFWWAEDGAGRALVEAYEAWAKPRADKVRMSMLTNMRLVATGVALGRMGYEADEIGMVRKW